MTIWMLILVLHVKGIVFVKEIGYDTHEECLLVQQQALEKLSEISTIEGTSQCVPKAKI